MGWAQEENSSRREPMFNYCFISGRVMTIPTLQYFGKDKAVTEFTLEISRASDRCGKIKVKCYSSLALEVAKHLRLRDRVVVAGFISGDVHRQANGEYQYELLLVASDVELLREDPDIEPELSGEDLLS
jgi:single-stranded DNA-binding protein